MARDDLVMLVRLILWGGVTAGLLLTAAALGDLRHLRCLFYMGVTLIVACLGLIVRSVILNKLAPRAPVIVITEAPSVAVQVAENAELITTLRWQAERSDRRFGDLFKLMAEACAAAGLPVPDHSSTSPMPKLTLLDGEGEAEGGSQAGLCAAVAGLA